MRSGHKFNLALLLLVSSTFGCSSGGGGVGDPKDPDTPVTTTSYQVAFSADQVVSGPPAPSSVSATASLRVESGDDITAIGSISVAGVDASAVTINSGFAGEAGPVAVMLEFAGGGGWNIPNGTFLDIDEFDRLNMTGFYVAIDTPQGRLRGQIVTPDWELLIFSMSAATTIPSSNASGTARAAVVFNDRTGSLKVRIAIDGLATPISATVRRAIAGTIGAVEVSLEQSSANPDLWGTVDINSPEVSTRLSVGGLAAIQQGGLYLTVDTGSFPDGAIRGQIVPAGVETFVTTLTDTEVVTSGAPVDSDGSGAAIVTYREATRDFGITLNTDRLDTTNVFVQLAPVGAVGSVIFMLEPNTQVPGNWSIAAGALTVDIADAYESEQLYVSIYTPQFMEGELRGQLTRQNSVASAIYPAVVDLSTLQSADISHAGGSASLVTSDNVLVTMTVPQYAVAERTDFSISEITSVSGFQDGVKVLGAVQLGPARSSFAHPVTIDFDLGGKRTPGTILTGFRTDNDGSNLRLIPLADVNRVSRRISTAREGENVRLSTFGFSNVGVIEVDPGKAPKFSFELIEPDVEVDMELAIEIFALALDANLDIDDLDSAADEKFRKIIRERRVELAELIDEFTGRTMLTTDDELEAAELFLLANLTDSFDHYVVGNEDSPLTSLEELEASRQRVYDLFEIYGAGVHLACFYTSEDQSDGLLLASIGLLLQLANELLEENPQADFEGLAEESNRIAECYSQPILNAYFESFDVAADELLGNATGIVQTLTDNVANVQTIEQLPDKQTELQLIEPRLVSTDPLVIEFAQATDRTLDIIYSDLVRLTFNVGTDGSRSGAIEMLDEISFPVATSPEQQEAGERPVITFNISDFASGEFTMLPTQMRFDYSIDNRQTNNGVVENVSRTVTANVSVFKAFTPRSFRDEIDLED